MKAAIDPGLKALLNAYLAFLATFEVIDALEDAIPIAGVILQAIGALGTLAEILETSLEVVSSPWTYVYTRVGT